jgi:hypothetical protein
MNFVLFLNYLALYPDLLAHMPGQNIGIIHGPNIIIVAYQMG